MRWGERFSKRWDPKGNGRFPVGDGYYKHYTLGYQGGCGLRRYPHQLGVPLGLGPLVSPQVVYRGWFPWFPPMVPVLVPWPPPGVKEFGFGPVTTPRYGVWVPRTTVLQSCTRTHNDTELLPRTPMIQSCTCPVIRIVGLPHTHTSGTGCLSVFPLVRWWLPVALWVRGCACPHFVSLVFGCAAY